MIHQGTRSLIDRLRTEGIPQAGVAGTVQVPEPWLPDCVSQRYVSVRRQVQVRRKKKGVWQYLEARSVSLSRQGLVLFQVLAESR
ncbi:putative transposase [Limnospira platensis NIES-39]|nr:putative transposase [Arthrospira platensis NIES-39]BDT13152.1 putative transposase [Arthrospira platensis NIES-39]